MSLWRRERSFFGPMGFGDASRKDMKKQAQNEKAELAMQAEEDASWEEGAKGANKKKEAAAAKAAAADAASAKGGTARAKRGAPCSRRSWRRCLCTSAR